MKKAIFSLAWVFAISASAQLNFEASQKAKGYTILQDLTALEEDRIPVQIIVPNIEESSVEYHMPRVIPGTYDVNNYGILLNEFKAFTKHGDTLEVEQLDLNRWEIKEAQNLYKITYWVDDSYEHEKDLNIFEPAGTSNSDSVFLLNNFGYIGYLKGHKYENFELNIKKPNGFYGSTALKGEMTDSLDRFLIKDYFTLHDNPIMYCRPDTAWHKVGGADVLVSVYSPGKVVNAKACMEEIVRVLDATAKYMGGELPVEKYAVLIYTAPFNQAGSGYGALEHHTSTVLYMPEMAGDRFYGEVRDITSHEFFHIITPLNIHSEHVADFDFIDPEMSEHIWLYEGVTEYNSHVVQIKDGIYSAEDFLNVLREKLISNDRYDQTIPLTQASKYTLSFYKDEYLNFYQKGAIAAMAVDMKLMELSGGEYKLINLLQDLGNTYGVDTFFVDEDLFEIIAEHSFPEMEEFLARYFASAEALPLKELFTMFGVNYEPEIITQEITIGEFSIGVNFETRRLLVISTEEINLFGTNLGIQEGDELISLNGQELSFFTIQGVLDDFYANTKPGTKVKMVVARPDGNGGFTEKTLKAKAILEPVSNPHVLQLLENPSDAQLKLREAWLNQ